MAGTGFEPVKAMPADLQSAPVDRLGILPCGHLARTRRLRQTSAGLSTHGKLFELEAGGRASVLGVFFLRGRAWLFAVAQGSEVGCSEGGGSDEGDEGD